MQFKKSSRMISALILGVTLGLGVFGAGFCVGKALYHVKSTTRSVTVKGIAERDVKSNLGIWELTFREIGDNLVDVNKRIEQVQGLALNFLKQNGFDNTELEMLPVKVVDRLADVYSQTQQSSQQRYILTGGIRVRSANVDLIQKVNQMTSQLVQQGITLTFDNSGTGLSPNPSYYFTGLDSIRPKMLAESTRSALIVAKQFAKDSGSGLGKIQHANQGIFQIMGRDTSTLNSDWSSNQNALGSIAKKVRLVTTIDYRLK